MSRPSVRFSAGDTCFLRGVVFQNGSRLFTAVPIPFRFLTRTIPAGYCRWLTCHWSWLRERDNLNGFPRHVVNLKTFYGVHGRSIDTIYCLWANKANRLWQFLITRTSSHRFYTVLGCSDCAFHMSLEKWAILANGFGHWRWFLAVLNYSADQSVHEDVRETVHICNTPTSYLDICQMLINYILNQPNHFSILHQVAIKTFLIKSNSLNINTYW